MINSNGVASASFDFWPMYYIIRMIISVSGLLMAIVLVLVFRNKKPKVLGVILLIIGGLMALIYGLDIAGHPMENLFGFRNVQSACYYANKGDVVMTVEGNDSALCIVRKKCIWKDSTTVRSDFFIYKKGSNGWHTSVSTKLSEQIVEEAIEGSNRVYVLQAKESTDQYLAVYDSKANIEIVSCSEASEFQCYENTWQGDTSYFWFTKCDEHLKHQELHIEIQEKSGIKETILLVVP
jgi:hypothetical protein